MMMQLKTLALALILAPAMAGAAQVYKWTDGDGVIHFGDRQPTGTKAEQISVRSGTPQLIRQPATAQEQLDELDKRQQAEAARAAAETETVARQAQRDANCQAAKQNLGIISKNGRIRMTVNGEQRFLTPEEIAQQKSRLEEIVEQSCSEEVAP